MRTITSETAHLTGRGPGSLCPTPWGTFQRTVPPQEYAFPAAAGITWDRPCGASSDRKDLESQTVPPPTKRCRRTHISLNGKKTVNQQGPGPAPSGILTGPPGRVAAPCPTHEHAGRTQRTRQTAACTTLWPPDVLTHGWEGEGEHLRSELVPAGGASGGLVGLRRPHGRRTRHSAPSTERPQPGERGRLLLRWPALLAGALPVGTASGLFAKQSGKESK